jgi:hypothetical protein
MGCPAWDAPHGMLDGGGGRSFSKKLVRLGWATLIKEHGYKKGRSECYDQIWRNFSNSFVDKQKKPQYEARLKHQDEEIAFLREMCRKGK